MVGSQTSATSADRELKLAFERIRHDAAETTFYAQFKTDWNAYRAIVNQMLVLSRSDRRDEALQIYGSSSRVAYNAASDTLGQLTDQAVASAQVASDRLALDYRHAYWLILGAIVIAAVLVVAARSSTSAGRFRRHFWRWPIACAGSPVTTLTETSLRVHIVPIIAGPAISSTTARKRRSAAAISAAVIATGAVCCAAIREERDIISGI